MEPLRILFVSSNPHWTERLDLGDEMRELLHSLRGRDVELTPLPAARREDLEIAVTANEIDVLHFSGHATERDGIILRDEDGMEEAVSATELRELLKDKKIRLAFLNACTTEATANEISQHVGAVIGTKKPLDDRAAKKMTKVFYSELGAGRTIDDAFREATESVINDGLENVYVHAGDETNNPLTSDAPSEDARVKIKNQAYFDKYFFISYIDEQIRNLKGRVALNRWIFRALLAAGAAFVAYIWIWEIDIWALLVNIFGEERIDTYYGKPYLDSLIAIGAGIPILLSFFQNRLSIHSNTELRSLSQMKELARATEDLSPDMQTRLQKLMDQCISGADKGYEPLVDWYRLFESLDKSVAKATPAPKTAAQKTPA